MSILNICNEISTCEGWKQKKNKKLQRTGFLLLFWVILTHDGLTIFELTIWLHVLYKNANFVELAKTALF